MSIMEENNEQITKNNIVSKVSPKRKKNLINQSLVFGSILPN